MKKAGTSRRSVLAGSATGLTWAWLAPRMPAILAAQEHAHHAAKSGSGARLEFFSHEQAAEVEAVAAQIIPSDDSPGAREAHSVYFIDRALTTFDRGKQNLYTQGLADLQVKTREMFPSATKFSDLNSGQQIQLLTAMEKTPFFNAVRQHTIIGFFANPEYGGNFDKAGWKLIGFEDKFSFEPPFGSYDKDYKAGS